MKNNYNAIIGFYNNDFDKLIKKELLKALLRLKKSNYKKQNGKTIKLNPGYILSTKKDCIVWTKIIKEKCFNIESQNYIELLPF